MTAKKIDNLLRRAKERLEFESDDISGMSKEGFQKALNELRSNQIALNESFMNMIALMEFRHTIIFLLAEEDTL